MESVIRNSNNDDLSCSYRGSISNSNESIVESTVTTESIIDDGALNEVEKKRKISEIYNNGLWKEEDDHEIHKVKKVVRHNIFKYVKFCKGEGNSKVDNNRKKKTKNNVLGVAHDKADLTKRVGYEYEVMKLCGKDDRHKSLTERAMWWKTYNIYVVAEIRKQRGTVNYKIRKNFSEGKIIHCYILYFMVCY